MMTTAKAHKLDATFRTDDIQITKNVDFKSLFLSACVLDGLTKAGFVRPSPIQFKAIPMGRCGVDLIVQAKSGTGKTCVFTVIALESIILESNNVQVLILAPTREIAVQISQVILSIGASIPKLRCYAFIGGTPFSKDKFKLKQCHIAVGTPGRVKQLIEEGYLHTESIRLFVLDEADKLIADGFQESINWIYSCLPENKQMMALSATYPEQLAQLLTRYMRNPTFARLNSSDPSLLGVKQYYKITAFHSMSQKAFDSKVDALIQILNGLSFNQCLIFCNSQVRAQMLAGILISHGWPTIYLAGCQTQMQRLQSMATLQQFQCRILVSTDLTARGIDAEHVNLVINMDVPMDSDTYLHRIGRAGRYGTIGLAVTLSSEGKELEVLESFRTDAHLKLSQLPEKFDELICELEKSSTSDANLQVNISKEITSTKDLIVEEACPPLQSMVEENLGEQMNTPNKKDSEIESDKEESQEIAAAEIEINLKPSLKHDLIAINDTAVEKLNDLCDVKNDSSEKGLNDMSEAIQNDTSDAIPNSMSEMRVDDLNEAKENGLSEAKENDLSEAKENDLSEAKENDSIEAKEDDSIEAKEDDSNEARVNGLSEIRPNDSSEARYNESNKVKNNKLEKMSSSSLSDDNSVSNASNLGSTPHHADISSDATLLLSSFIDKKEADGLAQDLDKIESHICSSKPLPMKFAATRRKTIRVTKKDICGSSSDADEQAAINEVPKKQKKMLRKKSSSETETKAKTDNSATQNADDCFKGGAILKSAGTSDGEGNSLYCDTSTEVINETSAIDVLSDVSSRTSSINFSPIMIEGELNEEVCFSDHSKELSSPSRPPTKEEILESLKTVLPPFFSTDDESDISRSSYNDLLEDLASFMDGSKRDVLIDNCSGAVESDGEDERKLNTPSSLGETNPVIPVPHCIHSYMEWVLANQDKYLLPEEILTPLNEYLMKYQSNVNSSPDFILTNNNNTKDDEKQITIEPNFSDVMVNGCVTCETFTPSPNLESGKMSKQMSKENSEGDIEILELKCDGDFFIVPIDECHNRSFSLIQTPHDSDLDESHEPESRESSFRLPSIVELDTQLKEETWLESPPIVSAENKFNAIDSNEKAESLNGEPNSSSVNGDDNPPVQKSPIGEDDSKCIGSRDSCIENNWEIVNTAAKTLKTGLSEQSQDECGYNDLPESKQISDDSISVAPVVNSSVLDFEKKIKNEDLFLCSNVEIPGRISQITSNINNAKTNGNGLDKVDSLSTSGENESLETEVHETDKTSAATNFATNLKEGRKEMKANVKEFMPSKKLPRNEDFGVGAASKNIASETTEDESDTTHSESETATSDTCDSHGSEFAGCSRWQENQYFNWIAQGQKNVGNTEETKSSQKPNINKEKKKSSPRGFTGACCHHNYPVPLPCACYQFYYWDMYVRQYLRPCNYCPCCLYWNRCSRHKCGKNVKPGVRK